MTFPWFKHVSCINSISFLFSHIFVSFCSFFFCFLSLYARLSTHTSIHTLLTDECNCISWMSIITRHPPPTLHHSSSTVLFWSCRPLFLYPSLTYAEVYRLPFFVVRCLSSNILSIFIYYLFCKHGCSPRYALMLFVSGQSIGPRRSFWSFPSLELPFHLGCLALTLSYPFDVYFHILSIADAAHYPHPSTSSLFVFHSCCVISKQMHMLYLLCCRPVLFPILSKTMWKRNGNSTRLEQPLEPPISRASLAFAFR